jgi:hypothetical protein
VYAAVEFLITTPQTISIALGAALITVAGYQTLLLAMAVVIALAAVYLLTRPELRGRSTPAQSRGPAVGMESAAGVDGVVESAGGVESADGVVESAGGVVESADGVVESADGVLESADGVLEGVEPRVAVTGPRPGARQSGSQQSGSSRR